MPFCSVLFDELDARMGYGFADLIGLMADHDENALGRRQIEGGIDYVLDQRLPSSMTTTGKGHCNGNGLA